MRSSANYISPVAAVICYIAVAVAAGSYHCTSLYILDYHCFVTTMLTARNSARAFASRLRTATAVSKTPQRRTMAEMPVPQSSKAVLFQGHHSEGWESTIAWFYPVSFGLIVLILAGAPVTDIEPWAKKEAEARLALKAQGFTDFEFGKHYQAASKEQLVSNWDKFSARATRMNDDIEDDEEEEDEEDGTCLCRYS